MHRRVLAAFAFCFAATAAGAAEVGGVRLDEQASVGAGHPPLVLNGAGVRRIAVFDVYAMALYVTERRERAAELLALSGPKRLYLHMLRAASHAQFTGALVEGIRDNHGPEEAQRLEPQIRELAERMAAVGRVERGARIAIDWLPGAGTQVLLDGRALGGVIAGEEFFRALLRIWLGERPVQADLKRALLGDRR